MPLLDQSEEKNNKDDTNRVDTEWHEERHRNCSAKRANGWAPEKKLESKCMN
jgi:uncharacterized protein (DUF2342 family)